MTAKTAQRSATTKPVVTVDAVRSANRALALPQAGGHHITGRYTHSHDGKFASDDIQAAGRAAFKVVYRR